MFRFIFRVRIRWDSQSQRLLVAVIRRGRRAYYHRVFTL